MRTRSLAAFVLVVGLLGGAAVLAQKPGSTRRGRPSELPPIAPGVPSASPEPTAPPAEEPLIVTPPSAPGDEDDDPMKDVDVFVDQNRRKARESIARLSKEAEELRARLRKVEMALERWKSLAGALDQPGPAVLESKPSAVPSDQPLPPPPSVPSATPVEVLNPLPPPSASK